MSEEKRAGKVSSPVSKNGNNKPLMLMLRLTPRNYAKTKYAAMASGVLTGEAVSLNRYVTDLLLTDIKQKMKDLPPSPEMLSKINSLSDEMPSKREKIVVEPDEQPDDEKVIGEEEDLTEGL